MKATITLLTILFSVQLFGQNVIDTNCIKEFKTFFEKICIEKSDTIITVKDSLIKYKVVFSSCGEFIDSKHELMRLCNINNIQKENLFADVILLHLLINYADPPFGGNIQSCVLSTCWGEPLADSIINIQSRASFWASRITAKEVIFSSPVILPGFFDREEKERNKFDSPTIISYNNGKFLIMDFMSISIVGNQTDKGVLKTYYLERIE